MPGVRVLNADRIKQARLLMLKRSLATSVECEDNEIDDYTGDIGPSDTYFFLMSGPSRIRLSTWRHPNHSIPHRTISYRNGSNITLSTTYSTKSFNTGTNSYNTAPNDIIQERLKHNSLDHLQHQAIHYRNEIIQDRTERNDSWTFSHLGPNDSYIDIYIGVEPSTPSKSKASTYSSPISCPHCLRPQQHLSSSPRNVEHGMKGGALWRRVTFFHSHVVSKIYASGSDPIIWDMLVQSHIDMG